jgi:hypothetical protein
MMKIKTLFMILVIIKLMTILIRIFLKVNKNIIYLPTIILIILIIIKILTQTLIQLLTILLLLQSHEIK